jgi:hypothetical protein
VEHRVFGKGVVEATRWGGAEAFVRFGEVKLWLPMWTLRVTKKVEKPGLSIAGPKKPPFTRDTIKARRMVEAFRYGIVPHEDIEDFTFGRDREIRIFDRNLDHFEEEGGRALLFEGEYGAGKTHLIDFLYDMGMKKNLAVCRAELDPLEVSPSKPLKLYHALVSTLKWNGGGFREFLLESSRTKLDPYQVFLSPLFERLRKRETDELLWHWISGDRQPRIYLNQTGAYRLPVLLTHARAGNLYTYILSALGWLAGELGLKGLLILLDELETGFRLLDESVLGISFVKALVLTAKNQEELIKIRGAKTFDLFMSRVRRTPFLYKIPSRIYLVMASTPLWSPRYEELKGIVDEVTDLTPLSEKHFRDMFRSLAGLYQVAYPETNMERLDLLFLLVGRADRDVRTFLKASIEAFDLVRHFPSENLMRLLTHG